MTKLIVLVDGSPYGESVCDLAAWVAQKTDAETELLHVLGRRETGSTPANLSGSLGLGAKRALLDKLAAHDEERARLSKERGRAILQGARERLATAGLTAVTERLRHGDLIEAVREIESGADLIVLGKRGEGADFASSHLGSNLERIVRAAKKPVLVASRSMPPMTRALIAFDGGESSRKAVDHIAKGRLFRDMPLDLLMAGEPRSGAEAAFDAAALTLEQAGKSVTKVRRSGDPEDAITDHVETHGISILVMGAYGHARIRTLIIGSTTTSMVRKCRIPVMLFR